MNANKNIPQHIAIMMDGNGRWARSRGLPNIAGHKAGAETLRKIIEHAASRGVKYLTFYGFSTENWKRQKSWVSELLKLLKIYLKNEVKDLIKNNVKLKVIGDKTRFSKSIQDLISSAEEKTKDCDGIQINLALSYSGRDEIVRAMKKILEKSVEPSTLSEEIISDMLDTKGIPDPELMIRPSGEMRISNFLLWQFAYTEFSFTPTLWPDFKENDLDAAISEFQQRQRRFGGDTK